MLALSIRQPYAELILRGRKRIEYRHQNRDGHQNRDVSDFRKIRYVPVVRLEYRTMNVRRSDCRFRVRCRAR